MPGLPSWRRRSTSTMAAPRKYPDELREVRSTGRPIAHVAKDLGIHKEALRGWGRHPPGGGRPWRARRPADHRRTRRAQAQSLTAPHVDGLLADSQELGDFSDLAAGLDQVQDLAAELGRITTGHGSLRVLLDGQFSSNPTPPDPGHITGLYETRGSSVIEARRTGPSAVRGAARFREDCVRRQPRAPSR